MGALKQQVPEATKHFSEGYFVEVVQPWVVEKISEVDGQSTTMEGTGESPLEEGQNFLANKLQALECRTEGAILQSQNVLQVAAQQVQELGTKLQGELMMAVERLVEAKLQQMAPGGRHESR